MLVSYNADLLVTCPISLSADEKFMYLCAVIFIKVFPKLAEFKEWNHSFVLTCSSRLVHGRRHVRRLNGERFFKTRFYVA
jgi:hypothetical protein